MSATPPTSGMPPNPLGQRPPTSFASNGSVPRPNGSGAPLAAGPGRPGAPNPALIRKPYKKPKADPLRRPQKRPPPRPRPLVATNGIAPSANATLTPPNLNSQSRSNSAAPRDEQTNGFSGPLVGDSYVDLKLVTTKAALRRGIRFHVAKFYSKKNIDPMDEEAFTRPVRLHRRDPNAPIHNFHGNKEGEEREGGAGGSTFGRKRWEDNLSEEQKAALEDRKAAREKEREENLAQIAPAAGAAVPRQLKVKQKTQQVFRTELTAEEQNKQKVRYEEHRPWHIEDFDYKNIWQGNYEAALSETYAVLVPDEQAGVARMIPVERWYKFDQKNKFKLLTAEETAQLEKSMKKQAEGPAFIKRHEEAQEAKREIETLRRLDPRRIFTAAKSSGDAGGEELDFEDDFADDEENNQPLEEQDEDVKIAEKRIREDQLKANAFNLRDQKEVDAEEEREAREKEELKKYGRKVVKGLRKREKNFEYGSDSELSDSDSDEEEEGSEAERRKEEEKKVEEERKRKEKESGKVSDKAPGSGASTKGNSTPSGRNKHSDPLKKAASAGATLKRPGSPNLSDASGTDTSRKKPKNNKHVSAKGSTPQPGSRPMSPAPGAGPGKGIKKRLGAGSDVEGGAGSGSDTGVRGKKLKKNPASAMSTSPQGSRAGSPAARSFSPAPGKIPAASHPTGLTFPTKEEIYAAIPEAGILPKVLVNMFRSRIGDDKHTEKKFISMVKDVGSMGQDKLLRPNPGALDKK